MTIERKNNEIIIKIPAEISSAELQNFVDVLNYNAVTRKSKAKQRDINKLATDVNAAWWKKNSKRFLNENSR